MKTKNISALFVLCISAVLNFSSCKSDDAALAPEPICRITKITTSNSAVYYDINYNADGSINTLTGADYIKKYSYSSNKMVITTTSLTGEFLEKDSINLNSNKLYTDRRVMFNGTSGPGWENIAYEYNGAVPAMVTFSSSSGSPTYSAIFNWEDGNHVRTVSPDFVDTTFLEYYSDKPAQLGDHNSLQHLIYSSFPYPNKNALKSIKIGPGPGNKIDCVYTYDADNKITSLKVTPVGSSTPFTHYYQYTCN